MLVKNSFCIYPFRKRILDICKKHFNVYQIPRKCKYDKNVCEEGLVKYIAKSWLCIACTSNYDYSVRKYFEISASGSVVLGNTNKQLTEMLDDTFVVLDNKMTDTQIYQKIKYYLDNKQLLINLSAQVQKYILKYNEKKYVKDLIKIVEN